MTGSILFSTQSLNLKQLRALEAVHLIAMTSQRTVQPPAPTPPPGVNLTFWSVPAPPSYLARTYALTDNAKPYYSAEQVSALFTIVTGKWCYARWQLKEVTEYTEPGELMGEKVTRVQYTARLVDVAPWVNDPRVQAAFPAIAQTLASGDTDASREADLVLTDHGWDVMQ
jgi:hypothetical protein